MPTIKASTSELNLKAVLLNGQCFRSVQLSQFLKCHQVLSSCVLFRWRSLGEDYYGVVKGCLLRLRRKDDESVEWSCLGHAPNTSHDSIPEKLHDYFQVWTTSSCIWLTKVKAASSLSGPCLASNEDKWSGRRLWAQMCWCCWVPQSAVPDVSFGYWPKGTRRPTCAAFEVCKAAFFNNIFLKSTTCEKKGMFGLSSSSSIVQYLNCPYLNNIFCRFFCCSL